MPEEQPKNYKLLIRSAFRPVKKSLFHRKTISPVQNIPFEYGLRIKNLQSGIFPGGIIKNVKIHSGENKTLQVTSDKQLKIKELNPDEEVELWVDKSLTCLEGLAWIGCDIQAGNDKITTYQCEEATGESVEYTQTGNWGEFFYITGQFQLQQKRTNFWLIVLTSLIFLEAVFGLRNILLSIMNVLKKLFLFLGETL